MASRRTKPIRLKAVERDTAAVSGMLAALEEKRAATPKRRKHTIWTEEFLASGKVAKEVRS